MWWIDGLCLFFFLTDDEKLLLRAMGSVESGSGAEMCVGCYESGSPLMQVCRSL